MRGGEDTYTAAEDGEGAAAEVKVRGLLELRWHLDALVQRVLAVILIFTRSRGK
jgi:hypothetical protein